MHDVVAPAEELLCTSENAEPTRMGSSGTSDGRPQSQLTVLRRKRSAGEHLRDEEQDRLREFDRRYAKCKVTLHLRMERKLDWQNQAVEQGTPFSAWIQERVVEALDGEDQALDLLQQENQRLRDEIAGLRGTSGQLAVENSNLHSRIERMESSLQQAMDYAVQIRDAQ